MYISITDVGTKADPVVRLKFFGAKKIFEYVATNIQRTRYAIII